jgi:hypothetical protein
VALSLVGLNGIAFLWLALSLPPAYQEQAAFNQAALRDTNAESKGSQR